jgi:hypothetical protein
MSATIIDDLVAGELTKLSLLATTVMNEHIKDHDLCLICGCAWPCDRVVLAERNLEIA